MKSIIKHVQHIYTLYIMLTCFARFSEFHQVIHRWVLELHQVVHSRPAVHPTVYICIYNSAHDKYTAYYSIASV